MIWGYHHFWKHPYMHCQCQFHSVHISPNMFWSTECLICLIEDSRSYFLRSYGICGHERQIRPDTSGKWQKWLEDWFTPRLPNTWRGMTGPQKNIPETPNLRRYLEDWFTLEDECHWISRFGEHIYHCLADGIKICYVPWHPLKWVDWNQPGEKWCCNKAIVSILRTSLKPLHGTDKIQRYQNNCSNPPVIACP